jgi:hypothetical protein
MDQSVYIKDSIIFEKYTIIKNLIIVLEGTIVDVIFYKILLMKAKLTR